MKTKIIFLTLVMFFTTGVMAEVKQSKIKGYVGLGFNLQPLSYEKKTSEKSSSSSGSGIGLTLNGGVILNDKARINIYRTTANVGESVSGDVVSDFWTVTSLGVSYDYFFDNKFIGVGFVNTTIKHDYTLKSNDNIKGSASSANLLLRGGYEYSYSNNISLLIYGNYDTGKSNIDSVRTGSSSAITTEYKMSTGLSAGMSLNYTF